MRTPDQESCGGAKTGRTPAGDAAAGSFRISIGDLGCAKSDATNCVGFEDLPDSSAQDSTDQHSGVQNDHLSEPQPSRATRLFELRNDLIGIHIGESRRKAVCRSAEFSLIRRSDRLARSRNIHPEGFATTGDGYR